MNDTVKINSHIRNLAVAGVALGAIISTSPAPDAPPAQAAVNSTVSHTTAQACVKLPVSHPGIVRAVHFYHGKYVHWRRLMDKAPLYTYGGAAERTCSRAYGLWLVNLWHYRSHRAHGHYLLYLRSHPTGTPVEIGRILAARRGWTGAEFTALYDLWNRESGWNPNAYNASSGACGIPQALPCSKIADHSVEGQIEWGFGYISGRYGDPEGAWAHSEAYGWY